MLMQTNICIDNFVIFAPEIFIWNNLGYEKNRSLQFIVYHNITA